MGIVSLIVFYLVSSFLFKLPDFQKPLSAQTPQTKEVEKTAPESDIKPLDEKKPSFVNFYIHYPYGLCSIRLFRTYDASPAQRQYYR